MNIAEIVELGFIPLVAAMAWWLAAALPANPRLGELMLWGSALLFVQTLTRDLWLLAKARRAGANSPRVAQCMCVESMIGMTGVCIGLMLFTFGIGMSVRMERWSWSAFAAVVLVAGFMMKDYVLEAKPWRFRRDKDHVNIVVNWRK